ncbi:hypothetical protein SAMN05216323_10643 [Williamwhitmania taraxaci]|uniref:Uncharacterized protein n=1 Tax=Williamwhitmania taraxaci TaxID=1640674 RepID=A0A1G6QNV0_9BACT|nr:hypothetical protein SAMN05216323_10643 [Williamwhitmania taraxaci]
MMASMKSNFTSKSTDELFYDLGAIFKYIFLSRF